MESGPTTCLPENAGRSDEAAVGGTPDGAAAGRRISRRVLVVVCGWTLVAAGLATAASWAYWSSTTASGASGASVAASVDQAAVPSAAVGAAQAVTVSWPATTLNDGQPVTGYTVKRYNASTNVAQTVGAGCSGTITAVTCTEAAVPTGQWKYTVTALHSGNWVGSESTKSASVTVGNSVLTLAKSVFGAPLPQATTGTLTGFAGNETIAYRLDGATVLTGSPTTATAGGAATITTLTIPAGTTDGPHVVYAIGGNGSQASFNITVDTVAPVASAAVLSPVPNGGGWNATSPVAVTLAGTDTGGSGITQIRYTLDGTDPTVSGTAATYTTALSISSTKTIKYYVVDAGGNPSAVVTKAVNIDTAAPVNAVTLNTVTGDAVKVGNTVYYRGVNAGSFTFTNGVTDSGGSGAASSATAALAGTANGFTHTSGVVTTPAGGPYTSAVFSWTAATTSSPTETITGADTAGNTTTTTLTFVDDSTGPSGGSVDAIGLLGTGSRYSKVTTLSIGFSKGTDTNGPAATGATLTRATAPLTSAGTADGACGTYGAYGAVTGGTDPVSPKSDTVTDQACYRYQYTARDSLGNTTTYTSGDIKVDSTAPSAPTVTFSAPSNAYASGTTMYYRSGVAGSFTVTAAATDTASGIASYTMPALGTGWTPATPGTTGVTTYNFTTTATAPGARTVTATNNATVTGSTGSFTVVADGTAPTGGTISYADGNTTGPVSVTFTAGTDAGSGMATGSGLLQRASATLTNNTCGTFGTFTTVSTNPTSPASNAATAGTCYKYQYLYSDNVGNQATYTSNSVAKVLDPATAVVLGDDDSSSAMFSLTGLIPGSMGEKCIAVTYTGTVAANVELYLPTASYTGTGLGSYVDMTIEEGTGGSFAGGCTGFAATGGAPVYSGTLANFAATRNTYATGFGTFAPSGGPPSTTRVYRFTYRVRGDNAAQGLNSSATFTWQAQDS